MEAIVKVAICNPVAGGGEAREDIRKTMALVNRLKTKMSPKCKADPELCSDDTLTRGLLPNFASCGGPPKFNADYQ